jgi:hypothetical protein
MRREMAPEDYQVVRSERVRARTSLSHPGRFRRGIPAELGEWLAFAVLPEGTAETPLRALLASYELFAACEGYAAIPELSFVRHLEALGVRRRGATFLGIRLYAAIPPLRLLTRLELYGFRFAVRDGELLWRGPTAVADLEARVIARHHADLAAALFQIEATRATLRGEPHRPPAVPAATRARPAA